MSESENHPEETEAENAGSVPVLVRDSLPSPCRTVLSRRPLTDDEKAAVATDVLATRERIIKDLREEGIL